MQTTHEYLDQTRGYLADATFLEETARARLTDAQDSRRFWMKLSEHLDLGQLAAALMTITTDGEKLRHRDVVDASGVSLITSIRKMCETNAREIVRDFGRLFPAAVRTAGIEIDSTSRHPRYTVKQGFIEIEIDDRTYTATLLPRDGTKLIVGLDIDPIVAGLKEQISRLFGRSYPATWPREFLRTLLTAYTAVLRAEGRSPGDNIPLRQVTNRLSKNLNKFSADEFNVDLAEVIKRNLLEINDHKIELVHTRFPRQGMLLHGLEDGGYLGFISFKKDSQA